MATHNYPKTRTYDVPDPEYMYGDWSVRTTPGREAVILERAVYGPQNKDVAIATEKHIIYNWAQESYVEVSRFTGAYLRARKAQVGSTTPSAPTDA